MSERELEDLLRAAVPPSERAPEGAWSRTLVWRARLAVPRARETGIAFLLATGVLLTVALSPSAPPPTSPDLVDRLATAGVRLAGVSR